MSDERPYAAFDPVESVARLLDDSDESSRFRLRLLARAVETMSLGVTLTDRHGRIIYVNPADARLHGYTVDELLGESSTVYAEGTGEAVSDADSGILQPGDVVGEGPWSRERLNARRDGSVFPVRLVSDRLYDRDGAPIATVTTCEDITERRAIERMKQEFLSMVSHELRTPLTSIIASLDLIADPRLKNESRRLEMLEVARRNSHRLLQLINDLLDLQKLQARKLTFERAPVRVLRLLDEAVGALRILAEGRRIRLEVERDEEGSEELRAVGDRNRLLQVATNLLSNAIKFSPEGTVVKAGAKRRYDRVVCYVADQGPGIPEEFRDQLFEQFTQADPSAARSSGGSGLGLSIALGMVEGMGGRIDFQTGEQGTTFYVHLPSA